MHLHLTEKERSILFRPLRGNGGFQGLLARLQRNTDLTGTIHLIEPDLRRIRRYALYMNGGYEGRLRGAFERTLGSQFFAK